MDVKSGGSNKLFTLAHFVLQFRCWRVLDWALQEDSFVDRSRYLARWKSVHVS